MSVVRPCIPTMSLGHGAAGHSMPTKLAAAAEAGFTGVEIFYPCLESFAEGLPGATPRDQLREAATQTKQLAKDLGLTILVLQPILNYDGVMDHKEHDVRVEEIVFRLELCKLLGTDMMQIPANFRLDKGVSGSTEKVVQDLRELADLGSRENPPIRFVYEAMCWSTFNFTWQQGWDIVQRVDRPNLGVVLDAFHVAGWEFADPTIEGGERPDGRNRLKHSLEELIKTIPGDRIFYIQLVDAERLNPPLAPPESQSGTASPFYLEGVQPRMCWSRNCRLFPYETDRGAYMPIEDVCDAFLRTGFRGWISFELFNRFISHRDSSIPREHAERGWKSWLTLQKNLGL